MILKSEFLTPCHYFKLYSLCWSGASGQRKLDFRRRKDNCKNESQELAMRGGRNFHFIK